MKYLGVDYGSKRIGLAVSDAEGKIAFPREVLENKGEQTIRYIATFCEQEKVGHVILGESRDYKNVPNTIQPSIENWKVKIENLTRLPVHYQPELLTSAQAARSTTKPQLDASAAALILQSYLDKEKEL